MAVRLFVGNLSYSTTEADLRTYFGTVAPPSQVVLPVDRETGRPRGFAFVEFTGSRARRAGDSEVQRPGVQRPSAGGQRGAGARRSRPRRPAAARRLIGSAAGRLRRSAPALGAVRRAAAVRSIRPRRRRPAQPQLRTRRQTATRRQRESQEEGSRRPRGPIPLKNTGRSFTLDDDYADEALPDIDDFATSRPDADEDVDDRRRQEGGPARRR